MTKKYLHVLIFVFFISSLNAQKNVNTINNISNEVAENLYKQIQVYDDVFLGFVENKIDLTIFFNLPKNSSGKISFFSVKANEFISIKTAEKLSKETLGGITPFKNYFFSYETDNIFENNYQISSNNSFDLSWSYVINDDSITFTNIIISSNTDKVGYISLKNITVSLQGINKTVFKNKFYNYFNPLISYYSNNFNSFNSIMVVDESDAFLYPQRLDSFFVYNKVDTAKKYYFNINLYFPSYIYILGYNPLDSNFMNVIYPVLPEENILFPKGNNIICKEYPIVFQNLEPNETQYVIKFIISNQKLEIDNFSQTQYMSQDVIIEFINQNKAKEFLVFLNDQGNNVLIDTHQIMLKFND